MHLVISFTVCKSLRNIIKATKPAPIPKGAKLIKASNFPNRSPRIIISLSIIMFYHIIRIVDSTNFF